VPPEFSNIGVVVFMKKPSAKGCSVTLPQPIIKYEPAIKTDIIIFFMTRNAWNYKNPKLAIEKAVASIYAFTVGK
jgi:hypothetical protein